MLGVVRSKGEVVMNDDDEEFSVNNQNADEKSGEGESGG